MKIVASCAATLRRRARTKWQLQQILAMPWLFINIYAKNNFYDCLGAAHSSSNIFLISIICLGIQILPSRQDVTPSSRIEYLQLNSGLARLMLGITHNVYLPLRPTQALGKSAASKFNGSNYVASTET